MLYGYLGRSRHVTSANTSLYQCCVFLRSNDVNLGSLRYSSAKSNRKPCKRRSASVTGANLPPPRPRRWLADATEAPDYLKRLRLDAHPRLKKRLDLATEYHYQTGSDAADVFVTGNKVVDLNHVDNTTQLKLKTKYDFLPPEKKRWIESPLKQHEYGTLLAKANRWKADFSAAPDASLDVNEFKSMKQVEDQHRSYEAEVSNMTSHKKTPPVEAKSPLGIPDSETYERYFNDRLRGLEGSEKEIRERIRQLEEAAKQNRSQDADEKRSTHTRTRKRVSWHVDEYRSPENPSVLKTMMWKEFYIVLMNEQQLLLKNPLVYNTLLWNNIIERLDNRVNKCSPESCQTLAQVLSSLHRSPDPAGRRFACAVRLLRKSVRVLQPVPLPHSFVALLIVIQRLRLHGQAELVLQSAASVWPNLNNKQLVQAANSIAKTGLGYSSYAKPLRIILAQRLMQPPCRGKQSPSIAMPFHRLSSIAALSLLSDECIYCWLRHSMENWTHFPQGHRDLHIVELYLRLCHMDLFITLPDEIKGFMEFVRLGDEQELEQEESDRKEDVASLIGSAEDNTAWFSTEEPHARRKFLGEPYKTAFSYLVTIVQNVVKREPIMMSSRAGPFTVPIFVPSRRLVVDVVNETHFLKDINVLTPEVELRHHLLQKMGFQLCVVDLEAFKAACARRMEWEYLFDKLNLKPHVPTLVETLNLMSP